MNCKRLQTFHWTSKILSGYCKTSIHLCFNLQLILIHTLVTKQFFSALVCSETPSTLHHFPLLATRWRCFRLLIFFSSLFYCSFPLLFERVLPALPCCLIYNEVHPLLMLYKKKRDTVSLLKWHSVVSDASSTVSFPGTKAHNKELLL